MCGGYPSRVRAKPAGWILSHVNQSMTGPRHYGNKWDCNLLVSGFGQNAAVSIRVLHFDLENKTASDSLTVTGSISIKKFGMYPKGTSFEMSASDGGEIDFRFITDGSITRLGFALLYSGKL